MVLSASLYLACMKMAQMNLDDRPREKMEARGAAALSSAELLAVILRTGTRERNAVELAREMLAGAGGSLVKLSQVSPQEMCMRKGIGKGKALGVLAALEIGRRMMLEGPLSGVTAVLSPDEVYDRMLPQLKGLDHEECWALYLTRGGQEAGRERLSSGNDCSTDLDAADLARRAVARKAKKMILVHNHPSGHPMPSPSDIRITQHVKRALELFHITLLDHVIITDGAFFSFSRETTTVR